MESTITEALIALTALTAMEIVLGIDNIVFIAVLVGRLPKKQQALARRAGLGAAMAMRIVLLLGITAIIRLEESWIFKISELGLPLHWISDGAAQWLEAHEHFNKVTWKDLILFGGGLFLVAKSVYEIHEKLEGGGHDEHTKATAGFLGVITQIAVIDIVFSLDSVITAVGMARDLWVMITAVILAVGVMLAFAGTVSRFVDKHPTLKMLALSFLILIGVMLIAEGVGTDIDKGYIYFAMAFALIVEFLNLKVRKRAREKAKAKAAAEAGPA
jgi:predicted tellurium resistance membrane protein TerC